VKTRQHAETKEKDSRRRRRKTGGRKRRSVLRKDRAREGLGSFNETQLHRSSSHTEGNKARPRDRAENRRKGREGNVTAGGHRRDGGVRVKEEARVSDWRREEEDDSRGRQGAGAGGVNEEPISE